MRPCLRLTLKTNLEEEFSQYLQRMDNDDSIVCEQLKELGFNPPKVTYMDISANICNQ
jgi:hypothetical protein